MSQRISCPYPGISIMIVLATFGSWLSVQGAEPVRPQLVTPQTVPSLIRIHNPELAAARLLIEEARARHRQTGLLSNPEVESSLDHDPQVREAAFEIGISQTFPVTSRLKLEKKVSAIQIRIAHAELDDVERKLVARAREAVILHLASSTRILLLKEQAELAEKLATFISAAAAKGEGSALDAGQARLEASRLSLQLKQLETGRTKSLGEIRSLLGVARGGNLSVAGALATPQSMDGTALNPRNRADYRAALLAMDAAGGEIEVEKARRKPDVTAGVFAGFERSEDVPEGLSNEGRIGVKFSIPIPYWNKNEGAVQEKSAKRLRLQKTAAAIASEIFNETRTAREEIKVYLELIKEIDSKLLPLATKQVSDTELAYKKSQASIQHVLKSRESMVQLKSARLDALRDANLARVRYDAASGKHSSK